MTNDDLAYFNFFQTEKAVHLVHYESSKSVWPSEEVLTLLAQNLAKSKNVEHLAALRGALPVQTAAGDKILSYELSVRLSEVHKVIFLI